MKKQLVLYPIIILIVIGMITVFANTTTLVIPKNDYIASEFISDSSSVSLAAFDKMMQVLTHKRCVNCHPAGDRPLQGEDSHIHYFNVQRGEDNHGVAALRCETCHQSDNNNNAGVPGAPEWALAPLSMAWEGLNRVEIARSMLDPNRNGGRTLEETVKHLTEHELVLWAWEPGVNSEGIPREKPPVSKKEFIKAVKEWAATGAVIPDK